MVGGDEVAQQEATVPVQAELPFALVQGEAVTELPKDLFIPPDALRVILEVFEGPLDLLLYLIKRQNLDILEIPIAEITDQYIGYVEMMQEMEFELAGEYLVMAAMLAEIKSRMLLPRMGDDEEDEEDPRAELVRRLQEYERFKKAAEDLDEIPRMGRETYSVKVESPHTERVRPQPQVELKELLAALSEVMQRAEMFNHHHIEREALSIRERMSRILERLGEKTFCEFSSLFQLEEGRRGIVVTFMAMLELIKQSLIEIVQSEPFSPIHMRLRAEEGAE